MIVDLKFLSCLQVLGNCDGTSYNTRRPGGLGNSKERQPETALALRRQFVVTVPWEDLCLLDSCLFVPTTIHLTLNR